MALLQAAEELEFFRRPLHSDATTRESTKGRTSQLANSGDEELVALAQQGDRRAFEELIERHKQKAYHIAFGFARDREDAKDLSQEAFLKAFTYLKNFDGRSSFYTWFYRIVVNVCLDYKRRAKRTYAGEFDESIESQMESSHTSGSAAGAGAACAGRPDLGQSRRRPAKTAGETAHGIYFEKQSRTIDQGNRRDHGNRRGHRESAFAPRGHHATAKFGGIGLGGIMTERINPAASACADLEADLVLLHYGDLDDVERARLQAHAASLRRLLGLLARTRNAVAADGHNRHAAARVLDEL